MLSSRIISTLQFFDLQDTPLTLLELHRFLIGDVEEIKKMLDQNFELSFIPFFPKAEHVPMDQVLTILDGDCKAEVDCLYGFYALKGRGSIIIRRWENYLYGIKREQLIQKFVSGARHLPFIRGIGLVGSQALGQQKPESDIDLLILVAPKFMWLARFFVTGYFQFFGIRRHGKNVANRFCLNHYITDGKPLSFDRNIYTAAEYIKLRPLVYAGNIKKFQSENASWMSFLYPNIDFLPAVDRVSRIQNFLERLLGGSAGAWIEQTIKKLQYKRINTGEFIVASDEELSFHPQNRKRELFRRFFKLQK